MKALSIKQPYADLIRRGEKIYEIRSWKTNYRGKLLICSSLSKDHIDKNSDLPRGYSICLVELQDIFEFKKEHEDKAKVKFREGLYAWEFKLLYEVIPIKVKGKLGIFDYFTK